MSETDNVKLVQEGYEKFSSGDIDGLLTLFADDIKWQTQTVENVPYTGPRSGPGGVREFFSQLDESEEITRFEPLEFIAQDDKVVVLGEYAATAKSTGRSFETEWMHLFHVRDGKIVEFKEFLDTAAVQKAFQKGARAEAS